MTEENDNKGELGLASGEHRPGIVIIGAGLAGLFTALKLAPLRVTVVTAGALGVETSSGWAQGGISAALGEGDSPAAHARDTIAAGAGLVDPEIARLLAEEAAARIEDLLNFGVPFDRDAERRLSLSKEAAHSARRVVRVTGDRSGQAIMAALIAAVRKTPSIHVMEHHKLRDLVQTGGRVTGVMLSRDSGADDTVLPPFFLPARAVVLAAGGIGGLYAVTTNPAASNGETLAIAARAGAVIADPEFVQFHPTAINVDIDPAPLATEALRGEGALLVNGRGERFMSAVHADAELAPRDVVARAVHRENMCGRGAFLDCRTSIGSDFPNRFRTVYEKCLAGGIDPVRDLIPVAPAAHYHMGGVHTDATGRTSIDRLWACGEVAATGAHGANRLASNSLLEAVVFAARVAEDIAALPMCCHALDYEKIGARANKGARALPAEDAARVPHVVRQIRKLMAEHVGVVRHADGLELALSEFDGIAREYAAQPQLRNMAEAARMVTVAALARMESRGAHFRIDFPKADPAWQRRTYLSRANLSPAQVAALLSRRSHKQPRLELVAGE